jgi:hypothetical protein
MYPQRQQAGDRLPGDPARLASLNIKTPYLEPGSPGHNGSAESFHSRLRDELLILEQIYSPRHAHATAWQEDDHEDPPQASLNGTSHSEFARRCANREGLRRRRSRISTSTYHLLPKSQSHNTWTGNGGISGCLIDLPHSCPLDWRSLRL